MSLWTDEALREYRAAVGERTGAHTLAFRAAAAATSSSGVHLDTDVVDILHGWIAKLGQGDGDCDFFIIKLVRLLFLVRNHQVAHCPVLRDLLRRVEDALAVFPYWPPLDAATSPPRTHVPSNKIVFWSENHMVMLLSSAHLVRRHFFMSGEPHRLRTVTDRETLLLTAFVDGHLRGGIFEVLSHVYLPYTISALLNLVDFAEPGSALQRDSRELLHRILRQLLLGTTSTGVCSLTASCRAYERTRERVHAHNVNQLVRLLTGTSPDPWDDSALTDFLLTTSYRPTPDEAADLDRAFRFEGACQWRVNCALEALGPQPRGPTPPPIFGTVAPSERAPFLWSAGLITHTAFVGATLAYHRSKRLARNVHLWPLTPLTLLPPAAAEALAAALRHFAHGQTYVGVTLNVYKRGALLLSSFENFNVGVAGYQQLPWVANVGGVGVYTQSGGHTSDAHVGGGVARGLCGVARWRVRIPAAHTHQPRCTQRGPLLVAAYAVPRAMRGVVGALLGTLVRLQWPAAAFDEEDRGKAHRHGDGGDEDDEDDDDGGWWVARRGACLVGVRCTQPTRVLRDDTMRAEFQTRADQPPVPTVSRACLAPKHAWCVLVGTTDEYVDADGGPLLAFRRRCEQRIKICENSANDNDDDYVVTVTDEDAVAAMGAELLIVRI